MIEKKIFKEMMRHITDFHKELDKWAEFGISLYDLPISAIPMEMLDVWMSSNFNLEGRDWIDWYLWERTSVITGEILPCYDKDGNKFYVNNLDDLWNLVKDYRI